MERSLVRPTNYNELGLFGGIRESIASECRELVRICHSILNRYFNRYISPPSLEQYISSSSFFQCFFFRVLASLLASPNYTIQTSLKSKSSSQQRLDWPDHPYYEHFSDSILEIHDQSSFHGDSVQKKKKFRILYPLEIKVGVKTEIE